MPCNGAERNAYCIPANQNGVSILHATRRICDRHSNLVEEWQDFFKIRRDCGSHQQFDNLIMGREEASTKLVGMPLLGFLNGGDGEEKPGKRKSPRFFQGWRAGILFCTAAAGTVLLLNTLLLIITAAKYDIVDGLATLHRGSCSQMTQASRWLHLLLNVLSTVLLAASNYCMQCLSAPTRQDVDKAHAKRRWLDIGVPSFRNLGSIPRSRGFLWSLLAISSIPLHLLYNSIFISTQASNDYAAYVGSPSLLTGEGIDWSKPIASFQSYQYRTDAMTVGDPPLSDYRDVGT